MMVMWGILGSFLKRSGSQLIISSEKWKCKSLSRVRLFVTPSTSPWNSWGWNTGVRSLSLLQGIFPTHGSNPGLSHCRWILYQLSHKGSPRILEWVAYPFSRGSSWPRNHTRVSCIAGGFFTNWATREAKFSLKHILTSLGFNLMNQDLLSLVYSSTSQQLLYYKVITSYGCDG